MSDEGLRLHLRQFEQGSKTVEERKHLEVVLVRSGWPLEEAQRRAWDGRASGDMLSAFCFVDGGVTGRHRGKKRHLVGRAATKSSRLLAVLCSGMHRTNVDADKPEFLWLPVHTAREDLCEGCRKAARTLTFPGLDRLGYEQAFYAKHAMSVVELPWDCVTGACATRRGAGLDNAGTIVSLCLHCGREDTTLPKGAAVIVRDTPPGISVRAENGDVVYGDGDLE